MRKSLFPAFFLCVSMLAFAQDAAPAPGATVEFTFTAETEHYRVFAETSQTQAEDVARRMEAALALYNSIFHFDLSQLATKFRVKVFRDLGSFNVYLDKVLSQTRTDFVFVAWSDPERSELLTFPKEDKAFTASLLHQGCIQFVKGFIDNPPVWLREGVATYLDGSLWDPAAGSFTPGPNLAWLDTLKSIIRGETPNKLIPLADLLTITREQAQAQMDVFAPESWGLVQFLLNAVDRSYSRVLWDSIVALDPKATLEDNSQKAQKKGFSWVTDQQLFQDFQGYMLSLKTAVELVKDGIDLYSRGDMANAELSFTKVARAGARQRDRHLLSGTHRVFAQELSPGGGTVHEGVPAGSQRGGHQLRTGGQLIRRGKKRRCNQVPDARQAGRQGNLR